MLTSVKIPERFNDAMFLLLKTNKIFGDSCWLAGGAIRSMLTAEDKIADYDLFFSNQLRMHEVAIKLEELGAEKIFQCPEGKLRTYKLFGDKIQLITENYYFSAKDVMERFDIRACRFVYDGKTLYYYYSSIRDAKKKQINFNALDFPNATMKRVAKYIKKGYTLTNDAVKQYTSEIYQRGVNGQPIDGRFYID